MDNRIKRIELLVDKVESKIKSLKKENFQLIQENIELKKQLELNKKNNPTLFTFEAEEAENKSKLEKDLVSKEEVEMRIRQLSDCVDWLKKL